MLKAALRWLILGDGPLAVGIAMAHGPQVSRRIARLTSGEAGSTSLPRLQRAMIGWAGACIVLGALMATPATIAGSLPRAKTRMAVPAGGVEQMRPSSRSGAAKRAGGGANAGPAGSAPEQAASVWTWPTPAVPTPDQTQRAAQVQKLRDEARLQMAAAYDPFGTGGCLTSDSLACDTSDGRRIISKNNPEAVRQLTLIASADDTPRFRHLQALYLLGNSYLIGRGVARDSAKGAALYQEAAEGGYVPAMLGMAQILEKGLGLPRDLDKSNEWYRRWAKADDKTDNTEYRAQLLAEMESSHKRHMRRE